MSPASARSSRPRWNTNAASASDACAAGRFRAGSAIRSHSAATARGPCPCAASHSPKVRRSSSGARGSRRPSASAARAAPTRSADVQVAVAQQRTRQVQRRRQRGAAQHAHRPARAHHRDLQAPLDEHSAVAAESCEQRAVGGTAAQEHVLAVVHLKALPLEGVHRSTQPRAHLHQCHPRAGVRAVERCCDPREAPADHYQRARPVWTLIAHVSSGCSCSAGWRSGIPLPISARAATHAFSRFFSRARRVSVRSGRSSMWCSRRQ